MANPEGGKYLKKKIGSKLPKFNKNIHLCRQEAQ
jgi:hypothetical protein